MESEDTRELDEIRAVWDALIRGKESGPAFLALYKGATLTEIAINPSSRNRVAEPLPAEERGAAIDRFVEGLSEAQLRAALKAELRRNYELPVKALKLVQFAHAQRAEGRRFNAVQSVRAKLARDPKQQAKSEAFLLWCEWQAGAARYRSGAAFARHIVKTLPIESIKTVERWMKQWREQSTRAAS